MYATWAPDAPADPEDPGQQWTTQAEYIFKDGTSQIVTPPVIRDHRWDDPGPYVFDDHLWSYLATVTIEQGPLEVWVTAPDGEYACLDGFVVEPIWPVLDLSCGSDDQGPGFVPPFGDTGYWNNRQENFVRFQYRYSPRLQVGLSFAQNGYDMTDSALRLRLQWTEDAPFVLYDHPTEGNPIDPDEPGETYKTWSAAAFQGAAVYVQDVEHGVGEITWTLGRMDGEEFTAIEGRPLRDIVRIAVITP